MQKSEIVEFLEKELSVAHKKLLNESKEELVIWSKKRFWIVSFLTFFGLAGVVNLLLNVTVGYATRNANEAAIRAELVAENASAAITRIEKSTQDANEAASEAKRNADIASDSANTAKLDAEEARVQASEAQVATKSANDAIEILQSDQIKNISETTIDLEGRVSALSESAKELNTFREEHDPKIRKMNELTFAVSSRLDSHSDKADALVLQTDELHKLALKNAEVLSEQKVEVLSLQQKIESIDKLQMELNTRSLEIVDIVKSGTIVHVIAEYDRLKGDMGFPLNAVVTEEFFESTAASSVENRVHCTHKSMHGYQQLRNTLSEYDKGFFPEEFYESYLDLANGFRKRECNMVMVLDDYSRSVADRLLKGDKYEFLNPKIQDITLIVISL